VRSGLVLLGLAVFGVNTHIITIRIRTLTLMPIRMHLKIFRGPA
jgi:hypothetical protein